MGDTKKPTITYKIRNSLYVNLTSACTAECFFCPRKVDPVVKGFDLTLWKDPSAQEVIDSMGEVRGFDEVVFCGFGEPTMRLETLLEVARWVKERGVKVRVNTNGHANLIHKRNVVPELLGAVDEISVSLNASDEEEYFRVVKPAFGHVSFQEVLKFVAEAKARGLKVTVTAVAHPGFNAEAFRHFVHERLAVPIRIRPYNELG